MSHRVRSKTVDSAEAKKGKAPTPRRLTEKIAIIKKREHEQSAEFEQAMQSIFEMQQARIHPGGGSMPSLQAIDSTPPAPTIDMQSIFRDFDEMKRGSSTTNSLIECGGHGPRRAPVARNNSMETEPYLPMSLGSADHYWNGSAEWVDGDLSRHKSDSDLQQSLMLQQQQSSPQHMGSPQLHRAHKMNPPNDLTLWNTTKKRPNSATTHALLSPDGYIPPPERLTPPPTGTSVGTASSLPDLTTIEFSSGLDVPLERDEPMSDPQQQFNNPYPPQLSPIHLLPSSRAAVPSLSPPCRSAGPSKLVYNSFQAPPNSVSNAFPDSAFASNRGGVNYPTPPVSSYRQLPPLQGRGQGGISKSPTMPEFRNIHSTNGFVARFRPPPPAPPSYKPILPSLPNNQSFPPFSGIPGFLPQVGVVQGHTPISSAAPPPMTIIIQPPPMPDATRNTGIPRSLLPQSQSIPPSHNFQQQQDSPVLQEPSQGLPLSYDIPPPPAEELNPPEKSLSSVSQYLNGFSSQRNASPLSSVPPTSFGLCLPSYTEARMQQSLQAKFASINVGRNEAIVRSHSEENLQQKTQKEKPEVIQHNPFMGTLANANSVPCVYVESSSAENQIERSDSPTTLDSPSTSASYASSPPSVRPYWIGEEHALRDYVFKEWSLDGPDGEATVASNRPGSPLAHHRSLSDLNTIPEITELVSTNRSHQLSLPSVAMTDLTVDEQLEKPHSPSEYYLSHAADFEMEEAMMNTFLKNDVPDIHPFDIAMLSTDHANALVTEALLSSSPDSFLRPGFN